MTRVKMGVRHGFRVCPFGHVTYGPAVLSLVCGFGWSIGCVCNQVPRRLTDVEEAAYVIGGAPAVAFLVDGPR